MDMLERLGRAAASASALGLLVGCATTGRDSYESMRGDADAVVAASARARSDDDRALGGAVLERPAYVRAVLDRNPSIEAARSGWREAIARVRQSGSLEDPMVEVELAPLSVGSSSARLGYTATISQRVPWPGKLAFEEKAAQAEAAAARSDFEGARRELALSATLLYDEYFVAVRSLEINAQHVALMRTLKAAALAQFESGRASAQDPLQAETELARLEHDAVALAADRDVTTAQMNALLHREPDAALPPPVRDVTGSTTVPSHPVEGIARTQKLRDEAVARRPEIASARLHARAEAARAERAERESWPDVTVSTSYNSMWDMPEHRWMVGLGFDVPLQLGRRAGAVEEAEAARARFESEATSRADKARTEVAVAARRLEEAHHMLVVFDQRLLPAAREQVEAARAGFTASRNDFVAVVAAEKSLRDVELEDQKARAAFDTRRAELDRALGRVPGIDGQEGAP